MMNPLTVAQTCFDACGISFQTGKTSKPAAFGLTCIHVRSDEEKQRVQDYGRRIAADLARTPGFLSLTTAWFGRRGYTITAWDDVEGPRSLLRGGTHREAMQTFFGPDFSAGGMTGVWIPHHINALWVRCSACGRLADYEREAGICRCGNSLQPLPYW